ncbi:PQQ-binding-like beta-propeller repeat protein [candidate division KSB1 bacterium]|nr:PQQ-binding-like beta-propeller repeat protein [candidate division KSB1 bacterium]
MKNRRSADMACKLSCMFLLLVTTVTIAQQIGEFAKTASDSFFWPMMRRDLAQCAYAGEETILTPPFAFSKDYTGILGSAENLAVAHNTLLATGNVFYADGSYALYAFNVTSGELKWRFVLPGSIGSAGVNPCMADSLVLTSAQGSPGLYALSLSTSKQKWFRSLGNLRQCHPLVDGSRVYICRDSLYCLDLLTGRTIWSVAAVTFDRTICLDQNNVYWVDGITIQCRNKLTGSLLWQVDNSGQVSVIVDELRLYTFLGNMIISRDKSTGAKFWEHCVLEGRYREISNIIMATDRYLCSKQPLYDTDQSLTLFDKTTGTLIWQQKYDSTSISPPVGANGVIYIVAKSRRSGIPPEKQACLLALNLADGDTLLIDYGNYTGTPIIAYHRLFVGMNDRIRAFSNIPTRVQPAYAAADADRHMVQNYPNPFNQSSVIQYRLLTAANIELNIYNLSGARVRTLIQGIRPAGLHEVVWDSRDDAGRLVSSGIYWIRMIAGEQVKFFKMSVTR